jgi:hypothetical protein
LARQNDKNSIEGLAMIFRFTKYSVLALPILALAACNDPGMRAASGVIAVDAGDVAQCRFVTNIAVEPSLYGPFADQGTRYARNQVLDEAQRAGANRVVFDRVEPGVPQLQIKARAYAC